MGGQLAKITERVGPRKHICLS